MSTQYSVLKLKFYLFFRLHALAASTGTCKHISQPLTTHQCCLQSICRCGATSAMLTSTTHCSTTLRITHTDANSEKTCPGVIRLIYICNNVIYRSRKEYKIKRVQRVWQTYKCNVKCLQNYYDYIQIRSIQEFCLFFYNFGFKRFSKEYSLRMVI